MTFDLAQLTALASEALLAAAAEAVGGQSLARALVPAGRGFAGRGVAALQARHVVCHRHLGPRAPAGEHTRLQSMYVVHHCHHYS